jgi:hypothetical protein
MIRHAQAEVRASGGARVLKRRRRIRRLEVEVAEAWEGQQEIRRRLDLFERIAAAAGAALPQDQWWRAAITAEPAPPTLVAASRGAGPRPAAVCLETAGTDVIAVADQPGDVRDWWAAICCVAARDDADAVTKILHRALPAGLMAVARRGDDGDFAMVVSDALDPDQQRDAVRTALRAARGQRWAPALVPVPVAASVSAARSLGGRIAQLARAHAGLVTGAVAAIAGLIAVVQFVSFGLQPASTAGGPAAHAYRPPSVSQSVPTGTRPTPGGSRSQAGTRPGSSGSSPPAARVISAPNPSSSTGRGPAPGATPSASAPSGSSSTQPAQPQPSSAPTATPGPTPTPTSSPGGGNGGGGSCVVVLGIRLCV